MKSYGPLSNIDIERLKSQLESHGLKYEILVSNEHLQSENERLQTKMPTNRPQYKGPANFLYINLENEGFLLLRPELERMGVAVPRGVTEIPAVDEYLCFQCDTAMNVPGMCPKGHGPLLEFADWSRSKTERRDKKHLIIIMTVLIIFIGAAIYAKFF